MKTILGTTLNTKRDNKAREKLVVHKESSFMNDVQQGFIS